MSRCLKPAYYLRNEYIVRKHDQADKIFVIDHGTVEIVSEDGSIVYDTMTSGDAFGEVGVMFNQPRSHSVRAQVPSHTGFIATVESRYREPGFGPNYFRFPVPVT